MRILTQGERRRQPAQVEATPRSPCAGESGWSRSHRRAPRGGPLAGRPAAGAEVACVQTAHAGGVLAVAWTPDGRLVSGGEDQALRVWTALGLAAGDAKHGAIVDSLAVAPDGRRVATGGRDGSVVVWDLDGLAPLARATLHAARVAGLAFTPDGARLASAGRDRRLLVLDAPAAPAGAPATPAPLVTVDAVDLSPIDDYPLSVLWSRGDRTLIAGTGRGLVLRFGVTGR